jgi:tagatose-1,6-bisphosphate aldolase non-catalytic subunit AgaZ/GatZ
MCRLLGYVGPPRDLASLLVEPPHALLEQFLPDLAGAIAGGALPATPEAILQARVRSALQPYADACRGHAHTA